MVSEAFQSPTRPRAGSYAAQVLAYAQMPTKGTLAPTFQSTHSYLLRSRKATAAGHPLLAGCDESKEVPFDLRAEYHWGQPRRRQKRPRSPATATASSDKLLYVPRAAAPELVSALDQETLDGLDLSLIHI